MYLRCVRATRASARDMCSILPARCVDLRGFTRSVTHMYLLCFNALRVSAFASDLDDDTETVCVRVVV